MFTQNEIDLVRELFIHRDNAYFEFKSSWARAQNLDKTDKTVSDDVLRNHLKGQFRIGTLPTKPEPDNNCKFIAADFDDNKLAQEQAWQLHDFLKQSGLHPLVELSHSGKGYHVWLFFEAPVLASKARTLMLNALVGAGIPISGDTGKGKNTKRALDRLFPAQDAVASTGYGNQIALPLYGNKCQFVDRYNNPFSDQWAVLEEALEKRTPATHLLLEEERKKAEGVPAIQNFSAPSPTIPGANNWYRQMKLPDNVQKVERLRGCEMIKAGIQNANQLEEPAWYAVMSNLAAYGEAGLELAHEFSKGYDKTATKGDASYVYDPKETEKKFYRGIDAIQRDMIPVSCKKIAEHGWTCPNLDSCEYKFIAHYGQPLSTTLWDKDKANRITNEERDALMAWEQKVGYDQYRSWFPETASKRISDYRIAMHLLGRKPLTITYPGEKNQVRSFHHTWENVLLAEAFIDHFVLKGYQGDRSGHSTWFLQNEYDTTWEIATEWRAQKAKGFFPESTKEDFIWTVDFSALDHPQAPYYGLLIIPKTL
ncbi:TOTE conflict system archaeo-eukaryotic primase domain-containing protein [Saccharibacillus qingshengii]|uniref:TOTE conflict system archaeo-eukaryotic primase domain-containing protein n=1 Tax=Saccharibacillus qingshengii TaxID=1763540 RepID=UPI0015528BD9|nr:hypothetical protein [Saccharibacillus qingshengii]